MANESSQSWSVCLLLVGFLLSSHVALAQAVSERRVALVIGNAAYAAAPLRNPVNDARAMSHILTRLGFQVTSLENATRETMEQAIVQFTSRLQSDAAGLFYYAGHGVQLRGRNYLVPVDAEIGSEREVRVESVDMNLLLEEMEYARNRVNVVILDACRNNPFERRLRGGSRGLAAIDAARGTLIAYATAPGSVARDGDGVNGLYTEELLAALTVPGLSVEEVFKRVRAGVARRTNDRQVPWESSSLVGEFILNPSQAASGGASASPTATAPPSALVDQKDLLFWESVKGSQDAAAYRAYLEQFPDGTFAALAELRIKQLESESNRQTGSGAKSTAVAGGVAASQERTQQLAMAGPRTSHRQEIDRLIIDAEADLRALRLTSPEGNNAYERYQRVLALEPGNLAAQLGIERIVERYAELAERSSAAGAFDKAELYVGKAEKIAPDSRVAAAARRDLQQRRREAGAARETPPATGTTTIAALAPESSAGAPPGGAKQSDLPGTPYKVVIVQPVTSIPMRRSRVPIAEILRAQRVVVCGRSELVPYDAADTPGESGGRASAYRCNRETGEPLYSTDAGTTVGEIQGSRDLWSGDYSRWVPQEANVYALGRRIEADLVFLSYYKRNMAGWYSSDRYTWEGYLFDIGSERVYHVAGDQDTLGADAEHLVNRFLNDRNVSTGSSQ